MFYHLLFHHVQFDRVDDAAFFAQAFNRAFDFRCLARKFDIRPTSGFPYICASDIRHHVKFASNLIDDRLSNLVFRKTNMKSQV